MYQLSWRRDEGRGPEPAPAASPNPRISAAAALPQVRVYDAAEVSGLLGRPEVDVPVTEAGRMRRQSYLAEARRKKVGASWDGGIEDFLKNCHMVMRIAPPVAEQAPRCLELLQRSNQFNLSGRRYSAGQFDALLADPAAECFAFDMSDDFGGYGVVGFAAVERGANGPLLVDFVMSCRVARKRVEETFLCWYAVRARRRGEKSFRVRMRPTASNGPLRDALAVVAISRAAHRADGADEVFRFDLSAEIAVPPVIRIEDSTGHRDPETVAAAALG